jgi:hypothetical protein
LKNGKKPTVRQRKIIRYFGKIPENWLVVKHTPEEMVIVHKISGQILTMQRGGMDRGAW